jgi:hypothetical protein
MSRDGTTERNQPMPKKSDTMPEQQPEGVIEPDAPDVWTAILDLAERVDAHAHRIAALEERTASQKEAPAQQGPRFTFSYQDAKQIPDEWKGPDGKPDHARILEHIHKPEYLLSPEMHIPGIVVGERQGA